MILFWLKCVTIITSMKKGGFFVSKLKVNDVAQMLGISPQSLRLGLQRNQFPFGTAIKTSDRYTYVIYEKKLKEYIE